MNKVIEEVKAAEPPARKCQIGLVLGATIDELLKAAPENAIARAHAMSRIKQAIPDHCVTYEQIKEWIETTIEFKSVAPIPSSSGRVRNRNAAFEIEVEKSETEIGRCRYSVSVSGRSNHPFTEEEVLEWVQSSIDDGETISEVLQKLKEDICDNADVSMDNYGDYDHDDYEASDSDNHSTDWNQSRLESRLIDWLRNNHPDKLEALEANE